MTGLKRILMLVLTFAVLAGAGAHEVAASAMPTGIAAVAEPGAAGADCPVCPTDATDAADTAVGPPACDTDCTPSSIGASFDQMLLPSRNVSAQRFGFPDLHGAGRAGDPEPLPPRGDVPT